MNDDRIFTRPFVLVALANLMQGVSFNLMLHLPGFLLDLGASETEIGIIWGIASIAAIAIRPSVGRVMDTSGRRRIILLGNAMNVVVFALYLTVNGVGPWVYVVRIFHGCAQAMLFTSLFTYAADQLPRSRMTQGLALYGTSGMLSISLGSVLGDLILAHADYSMLFGTSLGLSVVSLAIYVQLRNTGMWEHETAASSRGFVYALRQPALLPIWCVTAFFAMALAGIFTFLKTFVENTQLGSVGGFFSAYTGIAIVLRVGLSRVFDRVGPKRLLLPTTACFASGLLLLAFADSAHDVLVAGLFCGAGHGLTFPILFGLLVLRAHDPDRGSSMAIFTALFDVGALVGGPLLGLVIDLAGYPSMFAGSAGLIIAGALSFLLLDQGITE